MKKLTLGVIAHVDSGKTTLSEAFLYLSGEIRKLGRVDNKDAFLDTNQIERDRGITIFSKQATFNYKDTGFTLIDTPGHVDFSAEAERVLRVLDAAVLIISAPDGVKSHTVSLWKILKKYNIPVFIFVNKMDIAFSDKESILNELKENFGDGFFDMSLVKDSSVMEEMALFSDALTEEFLNTGTLSDEGITEAIYKRKIFPCSFGSALKIQGVQELLDGITHYKKEALYSDEFGAKVFKISFDEKGKRLTHMKITGGTLSVKNSVGEEKINEIRIYQGAKYKTVQEVKAGDVCAVLGLSIGIGCGLGKEGDLKETVFEPVFSYRVKINDNTDKNTVFLNLKKLEEEDSKLYVVKNSQLDEIHIRLMGKMQSEVLKRIIGERFFTDVDFEESGIVYKETIKNTVEGVGHYEPLRHYAEVHLMLEPAKRGSGLIFKSDCSTDELDRDKQRLVLTHLEEKTHIGVLSGSPITDMKITLVSGKAHKKHTEGGDFRQATYRAVRQGLMQAESILLEPWYNFSLSVPTECIGRAMTDIQNMGGTILPPETKENYSLISGSVPVIKMRGYNEEVLKYTHGLGILELELKGYEPCTDQGKILSEIGYDATSDAENPSDSVFCSGGAGFNVSWDKVFDYMHIELKKTKEENAYKGVVREKNTRELSHDELMKIFEHTYGKIEKKEYTPKTQKSYEMPKTEHKKPVKKKEGKYLLVDGYNILYSWFDLTDNDKDDIDLKRNYLINKLSNYGAFKGEEIIVVFDAYKVKGNLGSVEKYGNLSVVYTKEAQTADSYIEKTAKELGKNYEVKVATSDRLEQIIIFGSGAYRISAEEFLKDVIMTEEKIKEKTDQIF